MYKKERKSWMKHLDFTILDIICLELAYALSYFMRFGRKNEFLNEEYQRLAVVLILIDICVVFFGESYKSILRRKNTQEFKHVVIHTTIIVAGMMVYGYWTRQSDFSRQIFLMFWGLSMIFEFVGRSGLKNFIKKKMDVIVVIPIDGNALYDVLKEAREMGIYIICYDRIVENVNADLYITIDNEKVGTLMGEALIQACPEGGNIFAINGSPTDRNVDEVVRGFNKAIEGSNLNVVYTGYCDNWMAELAGNYVTQGLEVTKDIVGVMCGNDDLASQAVKVLSENRLAGKAAVVAQDADLAACQRIVEGTQEMTVYKPIEQEANTAAEFAVALGKGEDITSGEGEYKAVETFNDGTYDIPYYKIDPIAVTAENMDKVIIDGGFHTREDVYLNIR